MKYELFDKKNLMFGAIWGLLVIFIGGFLVKAIDIIQSITGTVLEWILKIFIFPSKIAEMVGLGTSFRIVAILIITILIAPLVRKAFEWAVNLFKKSPV